MYVKTVALLLADEDNAYQRLLAAKAREIAGRYGIQLLPPRFANGTPVTQINQFFDCISGNPPPDGIVSMLVSAESMRSSVERVAKAGIACVLVNRIPDFLPRVSDDHPEVLLASVAPDQVEIGRLQGRQCLKILPDGGAVVLLLGDQAAPSVVERRSGFLEVVGDRVKVKELHGRWQRDRAETVVNHLFGIGGTRNRPDLFVCQNDPMAAGVRAALDNQAAALGVGGIAAIPIIGCDGLPDEGQRMVRARQITATVVMPPTSPQALELLNDYWSKGVRTVSSTLSPTSYPPVDELKPR